VHPLEQGLAVDGQPAAPLQRPNGGHADLALEERHFPDAFSDPALRDPDRLAAQVDHDLDPPLLAVGRGVPRGEGPNRVVEESALKRPAVRKARGLPIFPVK
jgi:hypothetical protein